MIREIYAETDTAQAGFLPVEYEHTCDRCGAVTRTEPYETPPGWVVEVSTFAGQQYETDVCPNCQKENA